MGTSGAAGEERRESSSLFAETHRAPARAAPRAARPAPAPPAWPPACSAPSGAGGARGARGKRGEVLCRRRARARPGEEEGVVERLFFEREMGPAGQDKGLLCVCCEGIPLLQYRALSKRRGLWCGRRGRGGRARQPFCSRRRVVAGAARRRSMRQLPSPLAKKGAMMGQVVAAFSLSLWRYRRAAEERARRGNTCRPVACRGSPCSGKAATTRRSDGASEVRARRERGKREEEGRKQYTRGRGGGVIA